MVIVVPTITEEDTITGDAASKSSVIATSNADIYNAGIESDSDTVNIYGTAEMQRRTHSWVALE